jgi:hypothetical protein
MTSPMFAAGESYLSSLHPCHYQISIVSFAEFTYPLLPLGQAQTHNLKGGLYGITTQSETLWVGSGSPGPA